MSDRSATVGTFSDFKIIRGRKVAQIVVEIPLERATKRCVPWAASPQPGRGAVAGPSAHGPDAHPKGRARRGPVPETRRDLAPPLKDWRSRSPMIVAMVRPVF
jgi:hypothetical protein